MERSRKSVSVISLILHTKLVKLWPKKITIRQALKSTQITCQTVNKNDNGPTVLHIVTDWTTYQDHNNIHNTTDCSQYRAFGFGKYM